MTVGLSTMAGERMCDELGAEEMLRSIELERPNSLPP